MIIKTEVLGSYRYQTELLIKFVAIFLTNRNKNSNRLILIYVYQFNSGV